MSQQGQPNQPIDVSGFFSSSNGLDLGVPDNQGQGFPPPSQGIPGVEGIPTNQPQPQQFQQQAPQGQQPNYGPGDGIPVYGPSQQPQQDTQFFVTGQNAPQTTPYPQGPYYGPQPGMPQQQRPGNVVGGYAQQVPAQFQPQPPPQTPYQTPYQQVGVPTPQPSADSQYQQQVNPLTQVIQSNPALQQELRQVIDRFQNGGDGTAGQAPTLPPRDQQGRFASPQQQEEQPLTRPQAPQRPADYDPVMAQTDPQSASAQYLQQREQYLDSLATYNEALVERQSSAFESWQAQSEQQENQRREQALRDSVRQQLAQRGVPLTPAGQQPQTGTVDHFLAWADQGKTTIDTLWRVYQIEHGQDQQRLMQARQQQEALYNRAAAAGMPPPAAAGSYTATSYAQPVDPEVAAFGQMFRPSPGIPF